jgi:hypothetical protein
MPRVGLRSNELIARRDLSSGLWWGLSREADRGRVGDRAPRGVNLRSAVFPLRPRASGASDLSEISLTVGQPYGRPTGILQPLDILTNFSWHGNCSNPASSPDGGTAHRAELALAEAGAT